MGCYQVPILNPTHVGATLVVAQHNAVIPAIRGGHWGDHSGRLQGSPLSASVTTFNASRSLTWLHSPTKLPKNLVLKNQCPAHSSLITHHS